MESNFDWTIVKVETDDQITGYGEAFLGPGLTAVIQEFGEILKGEDPTSIDRGVRRMRASLVHASPGLIFHAISGIETALSDAMGKRHSDPSGRYSAASIATTYGSTRIATRAKRWRASLRCWCRAIRNGRASGDGERQSLVGLKRRSGRLGGRTPHAGSLWPPGAGDGRAGFRILKFDVDVSTPYETDKHNRDLSDREIEYAAALVDGAREAVGMGVGLAIDCHWSYGVQAAIGLARALEHYKLLWLEDPTPPENIGALGLPRHSSLPVATGENHYFRLDFERLILDAGLRVLAPDIQKLGLWEGRKVADMADMHYVNLAWHNISSLWEPWRGSTCAPPPPTSWRSNGVRQRAVFRRLGEGRGRAADPGRQNRGARHPGLGIELDADVAYKYRNGGEVFRGLSWVGQVANLQANCR